MLVAGLAERMKESLMLTASASLLPLLLRLFEVKSRPATSPVSLKLLSNSISSFRAPNFSVPRLWNLEFLMQWYTMIYGVVSLSFLRSPPQSKLFDFEMNHTPWLLLASPFGDKQQVRTTTCSATRPYRQIYCLLLAR